MVETGTWLKHLTPDTCLSKNLEIVAVRGKHPDDVVP
jgi:hypothetical protein